MTLRKIESKRWYKTVKVSYIVLLVIVVGIGTRYVFESNVHQRAIVDGDNTLIRCNWSNGKTSTANDLEVQFSNSNIVKDDSGMWQYDITNVPTDDILQACGIQKIVSEERILQAINQKIKNEIELPTVDALKVYLNQGWTINLFSESYDLSRVDALAALESAIDQEALDVDGEYVAPYNIKFVYQERGGLGPAIIRTLISLAIIILAFEITRQIFYFILTGRLKSYSKVKRNKPKAAIKRSKPRVKRSKKTTSAK